MVIQAARVQSPSSINLFKQCPRKYFYRYIAKLPTKQSIHTTRGSIVHSVLEDVFDLDIPNSAMLGDRLLRGSLEIFERIWNEKMHEIKALGLTSNEIEFYKEDSKQMITNWITLFLGKVVKYSKGDLLATFRQLTPIREQKYVSESYSVMGYIDAIENHGGKIRVMDYKTSKKDALTEEYKLQLAIYAFLYQEKHGVLPDEVGLYLLKHGERVLEATPDLVKFAQFEIEQVHAGTLSKNMADYPKHITPLCKWRTGQCDFYDTCFAKTLNEYY